MKLNENVYLSSNNWFTITPTINPNYQNEYPIQTPNYYTTSNVSYGGIYYGGQSGDIPLNVPIDDSICYAGVMSESPINSWKYALLSDMPSEVNRLFLGFSDGTKNGVFYTHSADTITLTGTLNTSSNTILIFDLSGDYSSSTEHPSNPFQGKSGRYYISPTTNSNVRVQLYGFNSDLQLQSIYNNSAGGYVDIDNSYEYYVFRLWIAGSSSFNNLTFTCKCTLQQQRSVNTFPACTPIDHGAFLAFSPFDSFYSTSGDGATQRWCYYADTATAQTRGKCQWHSMPLTKYRYNDIVYVIYIVCSATITGAIQTFDLDSYKRNYMQAYPIIRAFFMRPYIGNPDKGFNRVFYYTSRRFEPSGGVHNCSISITQNMPFELPPGINLPAAAVSPGDEFYMYGNSANVWRCGTLFGIPQTQNMQSHAGESDFSNCTELAQCNMHRTTEQFEYVVDNYTVRTKFNGTLDDIISICAHFGVIFSDSQYSAETSSIENLTDDKIHIPIITDGYITGEYLSGTAAAELPNVSWSDDFREKNGYDSTPAEHFDDTTILNPNTTIKSDDIFTHVYRANYLGVESLANWLYGVSSVGATSDEMLEKFLTLNPIDCVADLILYPFIISPYAGIRKPVIIGNQTFNSNNIYKIEDDIFILDFGTLNYRRKYGDFRDFEPYSDCTLQIPYHGDVHLKPSIYCGHDITVKCIIDMLSGASIALVYRDQLVMDSIPGQIGMHVQLSGMQTASYNAALYSAANGYKQAAAADVTKTGGALLSMAGNIGSGNFAGAVSSAFSGIMSNMQSQISLNNAEYRLEHVQVPFKTRGTNSVLTSYGNEQCCRLILTRPKMLENDLESFAKTHGFACCINGVVSDFSGFTKFSAVDLSGVDLSAAEKSELLRILQSGVYL